MTPPSSRLLTRDQHGDLESPTVSPNSAKDWRPFSSSAAMIFQSSLSISSALDGLEFLRPLYACTAREMLPAQCLLFCRSEEGRLGKECFRTCRSGWSPD